MSDLQPGHMLGPYKIIHRIGQGGMATVYKAYHASMDRYVALKVLTPQFAQNPEFFGRFQHEARLIAKLEHPHILPVHDFGESEGIPYLVMRYLDAGTLKERLIQGALPISEIDHIFSQLADALAYAHDNGIIHRDLKPSNAMLDKRGDVFLTDFGIAKMLEGSPHFTLTGAITGTPAYMSPEQAQGIKLDPRSDIYSLGIVLYEMITGRVPFEAETPLAIILKHIQEPLPPISSIKPDVHSSIEAVLLKSLAKDPADRFQSTRELIKAWNRAMKIVQGSQGQQVVTQPETQKPVTVLEEPRLISHPPKGQEPVVLPPLKQDVAVQKREQVAPSVGVVQPSISVIGQARAQPKTQVRRFPTACLVIGAVVLVMGLLGITGIGGWYFFLRPSSTQTEQVAFTQEPMKGSWTSWTTANSIWVLTVLGQQVIAGGPGGVTIFNQDSGNIQRITTQNGLPSGLVTAIYADSDNSLWIGTDAGLVHWNGSVDSLYNVANGLDSDYITAINRIDSELWIGTWFSERAGGGIQRLHNGSWESIPAFPSEADQSMGMPEGYLSSNVTVILQDQDQNVWVSTSKGIGMYDGEDWFIFDDTLGVPDEEIFTMIIDSQGTIWAATSAGSVIQYKDRSFEYVTNLGDQGLSSIYGIVQDTTGRYWFAGAVGLVSYDPKTNDWISFHHENVELAELDLYNAAVDEEGVLYFGTYTQGVVRYDGLFTLLRVPNTPTGGAFLRILPAASGELWFINDFFGVDVFNPQSQMWSVVSFPGICCPLPMTWDNEGNLWAGGYEGAWKIKGDFNELLTNELITTDQGLPSNTVNDIVVSPDGSTWIGTESGLVEWRGDQVVQVVNSSNGLAGNTIYELFISSDGSLWVGSESGVSHYTSAGSWTAYYVGESFSEDIERITSLTEDPQGTVWVSTYGGGIYTFDGDNWIRQKTPMSQDEDLGLYVSSIRFALDGSLWVGTFYNGLLHLFNDTWEIFTIKDGLSFNNITDIYISQDQTVWCATGSGVSRYGNP